MSENIKLHVDGEIHRVKLEEHQLGIICHNGTLAITPDEDEGFIVIDPETTLDAARTMHESYGMLLEDPAFTAWVERITKTPLPPTFEALQRSTLAVLHTVGLVALLLSCKTLGERAYVKFPETYLHPSQQVELADFFLWLQKVDAFDREFLEGPDNGTTA